MLIVLHVGVTPLVIWLASVVSRRLGPRWGGQLLGAPFTTGPFLALMCVGSGPRVAAHAAGGVVTGMLVVASFCAAYGRLPARLRLPQALVLSLAIAAAAGLIASRWLGVVVSAGLEIALIAWALRTWPAPAAERTPIREEPAWETPLRMLLSGITVLGAVAASRVLGSFVAGLVSSLPVMLVVMGVCVRRSSGAAASSELMRGALMSTVATISAQLVLAYTLTLVRPAVAFGLAAAALLCVGQLAMFSVGRLAPA